MTTAILIYLFIGVCWGYWWFFKRVRHNAGAADYWFYLLLVLVWPLPAYSEIFLKVKTK